MFKMIIKYILLLINLIGFSSIAYADESLGDSAFIAQQQQHAEAVKKIYRDDITALRKQVLSPKMQADMAAYQAWIEQATLKKDKTLRPLQTQYNSPLMIFVSFSMPTENLTSWLQETAKIHAPVVIRGFKDNSLKATVAAIQELIKGAPGGLQIDPNAFERFHIQQVPAVVLTDSSRESADYDVVYGNTTLAYALTVFAKGQTERASIAEHYLKQLQDVQHD